MSSACAEPVFSSFSSDPSIQRFVIVPDTQCYAHKFPEILSAQGAWIVEQAEALNIVATIHTGDIVEKNIDAEWALAADAFTDVVETMPTVLIPGNHDYGPGGNASERRSLMKNYFPAQDRFQSGRGGAFSSEGWNTWFSFRVGDQWWLLLGLEFAPRREVVAWAKDVLGAESHDHVIVTTHAYLGPDGTRYGERSGEQQDFHPREYGLFDGNALDGQGLWETLIEREANVKLVVSGHVPRGFVVREVQRESGQALTELLVDYQRGTSCPETGGDGQGFLQVLELIESSLGIEVRMLSYSPWLDTFREDRGGTFSLY